MIIQFYAVHNILQLTVCDKKLVILDGHIDTEIHRNLSL